MNGNAHYWPIARVYLLAFVAAVVFFLVLIEISAISFAYSRLGITSGWAFAILLVSIVGSFVNIPLAHLRGGTVFEPTLVRVYGMLYVVPRMVRTNTKVIALNVGGALIPVAVSIYLFARDGLGWQGILAVLLVSVVVHGVARVVPGVGVVVPTFVPPLTAVLVAWILDPPAVAAVAYVGGTVGTLVGADLLNLYRVRNLDAPVLSIGGAGTFDGIFVTGILAVLLAAF